MLHTGPPSTIYHVGNMDKFEYRIKSNKKDTGNKNSYTDIVIGEKHGEP